MKKIVALTLLRKIYYV